jgi:hypothetical protein
MGRPAVDSAAPRGSVGDMSALSSAPSRIEGLLRRRPWVTVALLVAFTPIAGLYVYLSFADPNPSLRILLRTLPILPLAVWTLWFDRTRPLQDLPLRLQIAGRLGSLLGIMALAVALLGLALNWLYDPGRVV